jgi:phenylacetic acid degradation operon negative regulatory protein
MLFLPRRATARRVQGCCPLPGMAAYGGHKRSGEIVAGSQIRNIEDLARELRLNAAAFIVTIYGDVVVPRGGVLWTGTLIDLCARVGINESLVRTAVSRLVAASQLEGQRIGRRSYYRLRSSALAAFKDAADLLYAPDRPAKGWQIIHAPELKPEDARRQRMGHMGGPVFIRPDRGQPPPAEALVFHAEVKTAAAPLAGFWDLRSLRDGYERFMALFQGVDPAAMTGGDALVARLLLVHAYRFVLLRDPRLPAEHLPPDWNAAEARALFRRLYEALSPAAHRHVATSCEGVHGVLPAETEATEQRRLGLRLKG